jgi:hypothetical protein
VKDWPPQVWASLTAALGVVAGWLGRRPNNKADAAAVLTDGALRIVQELQEELRDLRLRMNLLEGEQRNEREWCDIRINQLVKSMHAEGIDVPPPPPRPAPPAPRA